MSSSPTVNISVCRAAVVDIHGLHNNEMEFLIKEIAIFNLETKAIGHYVIKPPRDMKISNVKAIQTNSWVTNHLHHLDWDDGDVEIEQLEKIVKQIFVNFDVVYAKGDQKVAALKKYYAADSSLSSKHVCIVEVGNMGCPNLEKLRRHQQAQVCLYHGEFPYKCTKFTCRAIAVWVYIQQAAANEIQSPKDNCYCMKISK